MISSIIRVARSGATDWRNPFRLVVSVDGRGTVWRGTPDSMPVPSEARATSDEFHCRLPFGNKLFRAGILIHEYAVGPLIDHRALYIYKTATA